MIIAIDIGGSKVRLGYFHCEGGKLVLHKEERHVTKEWADPVSLIQSSLAKTELKQIESIGIGIAGPVRPGPIHLTNLTWTIDAEEIGRKLSCRHVAVVNDLAAHAHGIPHLSKEDFHYLQEGIEQPGNQAIIAAGTGLGQCIIVEHEGCKLPTASEGGHADFSPRNDLEIELLQFLRKRYPDHVSWERVVSGKFGFRNIYDFLISRRLFEFESDFHRQIEGKQDIGFEISEGSKTGLPVAMAAMELFVSLYGAEAGNLALKSLATGGVFIAGGIARRCLEWFEKAGFVESFNRKGRFQSLLEKVPIAVITNPQLAILGLAHYAYGPLRNN